MLKYVVQNLPEIIKAAAASTLGILALLVILLAGLALAFFRRANERTRLAIFILLFFGTAAFATAILRQAKVIIPDEGDVLTLDVDAESRGTSADVVNTKKILFEPGWAFVRKEQKEYQGKSGSEGDGRTESKLLYDPDRKIIGVEATATAFKNYGGKTNYRRIVVTTFVARRGH